MTVKPNPNPYSKTNANPNTSPNQIHLKNAWEHTVAY